MTEIATELKFSEALNFSLDVQQYLQKKKKCMKDLTAMREAIYECLLKYQGCRVSDVLTFKDGSIAKLTTEGFMIKE